MTSQAEAILARRGEIMKAALGMDYAEFERSPIAFDYEAMMAAHGYSLDDIVAVQRKAGVGGTPLLELHNLSDARAITRVLDPDPPWRSRPSPASPAAAPTTTSPPALRQWPAPERLASWRVARSAAHPLTSRSDRSPAHRHRPAAGR